MSGYYVGRARERFRFAPLLDRAERIYLIVLRASILIVATLLLLWCLWLGASSLYKLSRSPDSVVEEQANVSADELVDAQKPVQTSPTGAAENQPESPAYRSYYTSFGDRYYALFRSKFEPYRHADDKELTRAAFDDAFLNTSSRIQAIKEGTLNFESDRDDLETLYRTMVEAADKPRTIERLNRYKNARKTPVTKKVERTSVSMQQGWDSTSTGCANWYQEPVGCAVMRPVQRSYTENVTTMEYPKGTETHTEIFRAFQDRFFSLLEQRREANARKADRQRQDIVSSIADGKLSLVTAVEVLAAFLALMFFFLLIAIERHQRTISAAVGPTANAGDNAAYADVG